MFWYFALNAIRLRGSNAVDRFELFKRNKVCLIIHVFLLKLIILFRNAGDVPAGQTVKIFAGVDGLSYNRVRNEDAVRRAVPVSRLSRGFFRGRQRRTPTLILARRSVAGFSNRLWWPCQPHHIAVTAFQPARKRYRWLAGTTLPVRRNIIPREIRKMLSERMRRTPKSFWFPRCAHIVAKCLISGDAIREVRILCVSRLVLRSEMVLENNRFARLLNLWSADGVIDWCEFGLFIVLHCSTGLTTLRLHRYLY